MDQNSVNATNTVAAVSDTIPAPARKPRGFAAMDPALVRAIATKGGKAAHAAGTAHEFNHEEAVLAGRKGGKAVHAKRAAKLAAQKDVA